MSSVDDTSRIVQLDSARSSAWLVVAILSLIVPIVLTLFTMTNPEYNFPGPIELGLIAGAFFCGVVAHTRRRSLTHVEILLTGVLLAFVGILGIRYLLAWKNPTFEIGKACFQMPSYLPKLECLLQLPFSQNHGLRQIIFHVAAIAVFLAAASLSRTTLIRERLIPVFLAFPLLVSVMTIAPFYFPNHPLRLSSNFIHTYFELQRGTSVVSNPSWLWPLLTPAFAAALALIVSRSRAMRTVGIGSTVLLGIAILTSRQRGSYLLLLTMVLGMTAFVIVARFPVHKKAWRFVCVAGLSICGFIALWLAQPILGLFSMFTRIPVHASPASLSDQRLAMWKLALRGIGERPLLGRGYGSWLSSISQLNEQYGAGVETLDTGHNLWVQTAFELGTLHTLAIVLVLALFLYFTLGFKNKDLRSYRLLGWLLLAGFVVVSLVQELDYINAVYYQFALFAGLVFGGRTHAGLEQEKTASCSSNDNCSIHYAVWPYVLMVAVAIGWFSRMSWGGYGFDPQPARGGFTRWFRPSGQITAFPTREQKLYSVFPMTTPGSVLSSDHRATDGEQFYISDDAMLLRNGSKTFGNVFSYDAAPKPPLASRLVAFEVGLPPMQTNLGVFASKGLTGWRRNSVNSIFGERGCDTHCVFLLKRPACSNVVLTTTIPKLDRDEGEKRIVAVHDEAINPRAFEGEMSPPASHGQSFEASPDGERREIVLTPSESAWGWNVAIDVGKNVDGEEASEGDDADDEQAEQAARFEITLNDLVCK